MVKPKPIAIVSLYRDENGVYTALTEVEGHMHALSPGWATVFGAFCAAAKAVISRLRSRPATPEQPHPVSFVS
jgi:hypothetical protein